MDLVERFITASQWSMAKKTAVLALYVVLPTQLLQYAGARAALSDDSLFEVWRIDALFAALISLSLVMGAASLWLARHGREGRWTFYAFNGPLVLLLGACVYVAGFHASWAVFPALLAPLMISVWYEAREVWFSFLLTLAVFVGLVVATQLGLEYAPALTDRSIDGQAALRAQLGGMALIFPALLMGFLFILTIGAALRRDRADLAEARTRLDHAVGLISRYVPAEVASGILSGSETGTGHRRQRVTVFFSDIVGFTDLAEELEPEDLAQVLNEYFSEMTAIAARHHGTVDELQGDGLIILFGAPTHVSDHEHALDAVRMSVEMQAAVGRLNEGWQDAGIVDKVAVRMGINTGVVTVGHFGSGGRMKYTVLGKHVNLAARIQAACEPGKVLMSHATWLLVRSDVEAKSLGELEFKGIVRPVEVHELVPG